MKEIIIRDVVVTDKRFELSDGAGTDAIHKTPVYAYAVTLLKTDDATEGVGIAFTLGDGCELVCKVVEYLKKYVVGKEINQLMATFGETYYKMVEDPNLRWLGPHKGVVHLGTASIVNACFDLWAKSYGVPLWQLLINLSPHEIVSLLDFSYYEDVLNKEDAIKLLTNEHETKNKRKDVLKTGYPGYDTSVGWFNYSDEKIKSQAQDSLENGFTAVKLKVGSADTSRDIRRAELIRGVVGDKTTLMFDANQQWTLPIAINVCSELHELNPYWIEEPTHPDDVLAHVTLSKKVPVKLALGEHVPNKIIFKNYLQSGCVSFNQVDAVRVGGVSEFILISLLSKKYNVPVIPHVGDMGQIHQHLVLFNHISVGHPVVFLEYIPHLAKYFKFPAIVKDGFYQIPQNIGASTDFI